MRTTDSEYNTGLLHFGAVYLDDRAYMYLGEQLCLTHMQCNVFVFVKDYNVHK